MILVKGRGHMFDPMDFIVTNFIPSISLVYIARTRFFSIKLNNKGHPFETSDLGPFVGELDSPIPKKSPFEA